jgi:hypothetical protein
MMERSGSRSGKETIAMMIQYVQPQYGVNYNKGYIGFTFDTADPVSHGIAYFQKWQRYQALSVAHCFIVSGRDSMIEATFPRVREHHLDPIFQNPKRYVFFRKPKGLTPDIADRLIEAATRLIGDPYELDLLVAHAAAHTFLGRILRLKNKLVNLFDSPDKWICSELVAHCMDLQDEYRDVGCLINQSAAITPQMLFEDEELFEHWHDREEESSPEPLAD